MITSAQSGFYTRWSRRELRVGLTLTILRLRKQPALLRRSVRRVETWKGA
jgi:hypothetical protein